MAENPEPNAGHTMSPKTAYLIVGAVAAAVSAATVAYFFYRRSHQASLKMRNVEELLDRSHELVGEIQRRIGDLTSAASNGSAVSTSVS
jgi:hypothetical protein